MHVTEGFIPSSHVMLWAIERGREGRPEPLIEAMLRWSIATFEGRLADLKRTE